MRVPESNYNERKSTQQAEYKQQQQKIKYIHICLLHIERKKKSVYF